MERTLSLKFSSKPLCQGTFSFIEITFFPSPTLPKEVPFFKFFYKVTQIKDFVINFFKVDNKRSGC